MGSIDRAKMHLSRATTADEKFSLIAMDDPIWNRSGLAGELVRVSLNSFAMKRSTEFKESIRQLRCLEKELHRQSTTGESALAYIRESRSKTTDKFAREDLKFIGDELRANGRVDYAVGNTREALAGRYVDQSGFRGHASDCATSKAPALVPGPCNCLPAKLHSSQE